MSNKIELQFAIDDQLLGESVSPENISLPMLEEFIQQVTAFIKGSGKVDLRNIKTEIRQGSFAVAVADELGELAEAKKDYDCAVNSKDLTDIDPIRRAVLIDWQRSVLKNTQRRYKLRFTNSEDDQKLSDWKLIIDSNTQFHFHQEIWADVELYLYGRINDLGGKTRANIHLELDNGRTIKAEASPELLMGDKQNRIYKDQLIRIRAKQNIKTLEYRNESLISYENYNPLYDEDSLNNIIKKGRIAWSDIKDPVAWVNGLRGYNV